MGNDIRHAFRSLRQNVGFTASVVLTLAVAIGINTAIFSLVEAALLRSLPVEAPRELVFLRTAGTDGLGGAPPYPAFERVREEATSFGGMAAFATDEMRVVIDGVPEQVFGQVASGSYFDVLGVRPAVGRLLSSADDQLQPPVAVIGYGYWHRRFGGAADVIGRTLSVGERAFTIVGVTPPRFLGLEPGRRVDVTVPITGSGPINNPAARWFNAVARLRGRASPERAAAESTAIFQRFLAEYGPAVERLRARVDHLELTPAARGLDPIRTRFSGPLVALTGVAAIVLLIACTNLAGLLLVRGGARGREFAIRAAAGATSGRLTRQVLTETALIFLLGGCGAVAVAATATTALTAFFATGRRPITIDVQWNWRVVLYAASVTMAATVLAGLWPALRAARTDLQALLKGTGARAAGGLGTLTARTVVAGQVALSLALVVAAVFFARSMANLRDVALGFRAAGVLTMSLVPEFPRDMTAPAREQVWRNVLGAVERTPGVRAASLSVVTPLSGRNPGAVMTVSGRQPREVRLNQVSERYFEAVGSALVAGRAFTAADAGGTLKVAMLNESAAAAAFPGRSAIGGHVRIGSSDDYQVVGIVRDHKHLSLREPATPFVFVPLWQPVEPLGRLTLAVSSELTQAALMRGVADTVRTVYPALLISDVIHAQAQVDATLMNERLLSTLTAAFASVVLGLAIIGIYAIVSNAVAARRKEFGVRLALGAQQSQVALGVVRGVLLQTGTGILCGIPIALLAARAAEQLFFGVTAADPTNYALGAGALVLAAVVAAWLPARRACSVQPVDALRQG